MLQLPDVCRCFQDVPVIHRAIEAFTREQDWAARVGLGDEPMIQEGDKVRKL